VTEVETAQTDRWTAHKRLLCFLVASVVILGTAVSEGYGVFAYFLASVFSVTALFFAAAFNWKLHKKPLLWVTLTSFAILHIPLVILIGKYVPMKDHIDARGVLGIALADAAIMTGVIRFPDFMKEFIDGFKDPNADRTVQ
jgi:hypothetical protein